MATLYVTEFSGIGSGNKTDIQAAACPPLAEQTVAIGGSTAQSAAFDAATKVIRVHTDAICSVKIGGANPVAAATNARLAANQTEYFRVNAGDKIAVIQNT